MMIVKARQHCCTSRVDDAFVRAKWLEIRSHFEHHRVRAQVDDAALNVGMLYQHDRCPVILRGMAAIVSPQELSAILSSALRAEDHSVVAGTNYLVADLRVQHTDIPLKHWPAAPVIGLTSAQQPVAAVDLMVADEQALAQVTDAIDAQPLAAATLVQVLRHNETTDIRQGLLAESLAYSTLQQSAGFQEWLRTRARPESKADDEPPLLIEHHDHGANTVLELVFNRPHAHNAYSTDLKDALCAALLVAHADTGIREVQLRGNGPSFSAGGDLSEFGSVTDAGAAHLSRTTRSAGALLASLPCATSAHLHGACIGAGIELPAFTKHISADPDTFFQLPEVAMGLVPGAGGTVSVLKRIGRQHTAWLAITSERLDAQSALAWGLVDELRG